MTYQKHENIEERDNLSLICAIGYIGIMVGRILFAVFDTSANFDSANWSTQNLQLYRLGVLFSMIGIGSILYMMCNILLKKYFTTAIMIHFVVFIYLSLIINDLTYASATLSQSFIGIAIIPTIFINFYYFFSALKNKGIVRKKFLLITFGCFLSGFSIIITSEQLILLIMYITPLSRIIIHSISYLLCGIGYSLTFMGLKLIIPEKHLESLISDNAKERIETLGLNLPKKENIFKLISENANDLIAILNTEFKFIFLNSSIHHNLLNYNSSDLMNQKIESFIHQDDLSNFLKILHDVLNQKDGYIQIRFRHQNGTYLWLEIMASPLISNNGQKKNSYHFERHYRTKEIL